MMGSTVSEAKRLKLENEQRSIMDNQPNGMNPVNNMAKLPEEILERIFSYVTAPGDLQNLCRSSPQFSRVLGPTKPVWLLDKVFSSIFPELEKSDILNCRLVCKQWKTDIDDFLQTQPLIRVMEDYKPASPAGALMPRSPGYAPKFQFNLARKQFTCNQFLDVTSITDFMEKSNHHVGNPFVLRAINLDDGPYSNEVQDVYWACAFDLLNTYGEHVWHLYIHIVHDNHRHKGRYCYNQLRRCLGYMPNLKTLAVRGFIYHAPAAYNHNRTARLRQFIEEHPLPSLPLLQVLEIGLHCTAENQALYNQLIKKYLGTARTVITPLSLWMSPQNLDPLLQLTRLEIFVDQTVFKWDVFCNLIRAPNLGKITLIIQENLDIRRILRSLGQLPSLEYLGWRFYREPAYGSGKLNPSMPKFTLPQIKTVEIVDNPYVPYSVLFEHLPNLEYILICGEEADWWKPGVHYVRRENDDEDKRHYYFQKWIFSQSMKGTCIWELMKDLKEVTLAWMGTNNFLLYEIIKKSQYTREMYEKRENCVDRWATNG